MPPAAHVVVTGPIGSGKSTVARAAMELLGWTRPVGFRTHWGGAERGAPVLYLEPWGGASIAIARRVADTAEEGEAPYELDADVFHSAALPCLEAGAADRPVVVDELGPIELRAASFVAGVRAAFRAEIPWLAVIQERALERWLAHLRETGTPFTVMVVDAANRNDLPRRIAALLQPARA
ncbi:MAG: hypothetical protein GX803_06830 [Lentisphaerae bacterium]|jgi:nucleoside-triphosphatase THEP1|nr:hypothetical protein [Lentisphaerota bacterium]